MNEMDIKLGHTKKTYSVREEGYPCNSELETFSEFKDALKFAKEQSKNSKYRISIANTDSEDCEGPMWDGEDVVSNYHNGLTEEEQDICDEELY